MKQTKKVSGESVSTLMRRARTAKLAEAKKLRAKAATMRKAKRAKPPHQFAEVKQAMDREIYGDKMVATHDAGSNDWTINRAPSAADNLDVKAHGLIALGRKKGGVQAVTNELLQLAASMRYEGVKATEAIARKERESITQAMDERIVCSFIAEIETMMTIKRGLPPGDMIMVSPLIVTKVIDALNRAGYTAKGRR